MLRPWVSWGPGFMGAQREPGVGLVLGWDGSGIPREVGCFLHSPPTGRVSVHGDARTWGQMIRVVPTCISYLPQCIRSSFFFFK